MKAAVVAITALCTGCVVLPETKETTTVTTTTSKLTVDPVGPSELTATASGGTLVGTADYHRECWRAVDEVKQTTRKREATVEIEGTPTGLGDILALALTAPATGAVSGIVSAIIIAASRPKTTRLLSHDVVLIPCSVAAVNEPVAALLPSGTTVEAVTDAAGRFSMPIPASEPAGMIRVSAIGTTLSFPLVR